MLKQKLATAKKYLAATSVGISMAVMSLPTHAALNDSIKNAINGGFGDANEAAGLVIAGLAGIFAIMLIRRVLR